MSQRAEYISKMEAQLDKLNQKMSSLETGAQEAKEEARQTYKEEMGKLRLKSKGAIAKLEELKASTEDSWETMVGDMEKMHDAFSSHQPPGQGISPSDLSTLNPQCSARHRHEVLLGQLVAAGRCLAPMQHLLRASQRWNRLQHAPPADCRPLTGLGINTRCDATQWDCATIIAGI